MAKYPAMLFVLALVLATAFPSTSKTSWMRPESFRLTVGMTRAEAVETLQKGGWTPQKGDDDLHLVVDYTPTQSLTLEFHNDRLRSIRFELYSVINEIGGAFEEERAYLRKSFGEPRSVKVKNVLIYDSMLPNVMAVVDDDPKSTNGKRGLGVLVVRYYDPAGTK